MRIQATLAVLAASLAVGCGSDPVPPQGWVGDLVITGPDHKPLPPRLTAVAGDAVDLVVGFRLGTADPDAFPDRKVREPYQWRLRAEVLDASGALQAAQPVASIYGELHGFDLRGQEQVDANGSSSAGEVVWTSPEPTREIKQALKDLKQDPKNVRIRRHLWGHTPVPDEPGEYRVVLRLYPTADPRFSGELDPDMGAPVDLAEFPLLVAPRDVDRPKIVASLTSDRFFGGLGSRPMAGGGRGPGPLSGGGRGPR